MSEIFKNTNSKITINEELAIQLENVELTLPSLAGEVQILRRIYRGCRSFWWRKIKHDDGYCWPRKSNIRRC